MKPMTRAFAGPVASIVWTLLMASSFPCVAAPPEGPPLSVDGVEVLRPFFNPSAGERVEIRFRVSEKAEVIAHILDALQERIVSLADGGRAEGGIRVFRWDGRDCQGTIVPDEAYSFRIEAWEQGRYAFYDRTSSPGLMHEIERVTYLPEQKQLEYSLPENGRVCIKAGIAEGPLLAIPVDWEPRPKGIQRADWDGFDRDGLIEVLTHPRYRLRGSYVSLPENAIITNGNTHLTWLEYRRQRPSSDTSPTSAPSTVRPICPEREEPVSKIASGSTSSTPVTVQSDSLLRSDLDRKTPFHYKSPALEIQLSGTERDGQNKTRSAYVLTIQTGFDPEWQAHLSSRLYEIYYFLDAAFLMEEPWLRLPHEGQLELKEHTDGLHVLTVNVIHDDGQTGVKNIRVKLE